MSRVCVLANPVYCTENKVSSEQENTKKPIRSQIVVTAKQQNHFLETVQQISTVEVTNQFSVC